MRWVGRGTDRPGNARESATAIALRRFVLLLFTVGAVSAEGDLLLIGHYEDAWQFAPLILVGASLTALGWWAASSMRSALRVFQVMMLCLIAGGLTGLWLHYRANTEFEREVYPSLEGFGLFWKAIRGASPPTLAPAALIHLGLLGLASTYRLPDHTGDQR